MVKVEKPENHPSGAKEAAEKGLFEGEILPRVLQGLKPNIDLIGFIGLTEVMPLLQSLRERIFRRVFPQTVKPVPFSGKP